MLGPVVFRSRIVVKSNWRLSFTYSSQIRPQYRCLSAARSPRNIVPANHDNAIMSSTTTTTQTITADNVLRLFPEVVNTSVIGSSRSASHDADLAGYDEEQIRLMEEVCIVLDEDDRPIGSASKKDCPSPLHHLTFASPTDQTPFQATS